MKKIKSESQLEKKKWNAFISENDTGGGFLQSWEWGEFQQELKRKIFRISVKSDKKISAIALVVKHEFFFGQNYLYVPRGPIVRNFEFVEIISEIKKLGINHKSLFIRIDPALQNDDVILKFNFNQIGQVQPKKTLILNLNKSEEEILLEMKPKTRYNIRLAQKHGVEIKEARPVNFDNFWNLMVKTCARDGIKSYSKNYYQKQLKISGFKLILAWWKNKVVAGAIISDFGNVRTYVHGASDYEFRDKMAPYLLQWEMICEAQKRNMKYYDFWGADESNPKWFGVTRFKVGFAPQKLLTEYIGAYDLVLRPNIYKLYKLFKK